MDNESMRRISLANTEHSQPLNLNILQLNIPIFLKYAPEFHRKSFVRYKALLPHIAEHVIVQKLYKNKCRINVSSEDKNNLIIVRVPTKKDTP